MRKIESGEFISNSKTPWTVERLEKTSDKVVEKLYEKYVNPPPVKVNKQEALEMGKTRLSCGDRDVCRRPENSDRANAFR